jgi:hypothetical protein
MRRRTFIKLAGAAGAGILLPVPWRRAAAALPSGLQYQKPAEGLPKLIHVFLYGGPSELAGNLTNIVEIQQNSQYAYDAHLVQESGGVLSPGASVTTNGFWGPSTPGTDDDSAGGDSMERLVASGDLTVYRTVNRVKDDNKGHGASVAQDLAGNLSVDAPGMAATLGALLASHGAFGKPLDQLIMPVISFDGDARVFGAGDLDLPLALQPMSLNPDFQNPYSRARSEALSAADPVNAQLDALAAQVSGRLAGVTRINEAFARRAGLDQFITDHFSQAAVDASLAALGITYPDTNFGSRLRAAVYLALANEDTFFVNLGSGGLGGWDDHSEALREYPSRMRELMQALEVAVAHLRAAEVAGNAAASRIYINVFGDFGRNVNLNASRGWDHGNNQNLFTLGGAGIAGRTLGKVVGRTERVGTAFENRQFTSPAAGSYQCEPFAIASTMYRYFGVQNPELLTGEPPIDEGAADEYVVPATPY